MARRWRVASEIAGDGLRSVVVRGARRRVGAGQGASERGWGLGEGDGARAWGAKIAPRGWARFRGGQPRDAQWALGRGRGESVQRADGGLRGWDPRKGCT